MKVGKLLKMTNYFLNNSKVSFEGLLSLRANLGVELLRDPNDKILRSALNRIDQRLNTVTANDIIRQIDSLSEG